MTETATLAAGCFWGVEETFRNTPGVLRTMVGYTGGRAEQPSYELVCTGATGHAEAVRVEFDPAVLSYADLLAVFWGLHDPTTPNRQGPDVGSQYRSAIFTHSPEQEETAALSRAAEDRSGRHGAPIVTEIVPAGPFWPAEEYHQQYYARRGMRGCRL